MGRKKARRDSNVHGKRLFEEEVSPSSPPKLIPIRKRPANQQLSPDITSLGREIRMEQVPPPSKRSVGALAEATTQKEKNEANLPPEVIRTPQPMATTKPQPEPGQPLSIAFKPPEDDMVVGLFTSGTCYCNSKVKKDNIVVGQCNHMVCTDCFLNGCPVCKDEAAKKSITEGATSGNRLTVQDYRAEKVVVVDDVFKDKGFDFQLELQITGSDSTA